MFCRFDVQIFAGDLRGQAASALSIPSFRDETNAIKLRAAARLATVSLFVDSNREFFFSNVIFEDRQLHQQTARGIFRIFFRKLALPIFYFYKYLKISIATTNTFSWEI